MTPPIGAARAAVTAQGGSAIPGSGLEHHYDATELSLNDGDGVTSWSDLEGSGDLTGSGPTYVADGINGNPVVSHDGVDDVLTAAFSVISQPVHIFVVHRMNSLSTGSSQDIIFDAEDDSLTNRHNFYASEDPGTGDRTWGIYADAGPVRGDLADTNPHIHAPLSNGSNSTIRKDGQQTASGDAGTDPLDGLRTGSRSDGSEWGEVDIGEIIIYSEEKSGSELDDIEQHLSDKWGVSLA